MYQLEELEAWKKARAFRKEISSMAKLLPEYEKYKLRDQLIRASRSIPANIAEGHGRFHYQENIQFCRQARGSLVECLEHLICAFDEEYISEIELQKFRKLYDELLKILNGYIAYLGKQKLISKGT